MTQPTRSRRARRATRVRGRGAGDDHEQRHSEIAPEQARVERSEHAVGNGLDAPASFDPLGGAPIDG